MRISNTIKKGIIPTNPTDNQVLDWKEIVSKMLNNSNSCESINLNSLQKYYKIHSLENKFCVLETKLSDSKQQWGTFIVKMNHEDKKFVHFQCPHPITDGYVLEQSFRVFKKVIKSKSLLISGTMRNVSLSEKNDCQKYLKYDKAHNDEFLFQKTTEMISKDDILFQFHGMAETTCKEDVFISNGFKYWNKTEISIGDKNMLKLTSISRSISKDWNIQNSKTSECRLVGASNVQGRLHNGVNPKKVCKENPKLPFGNFIHIEQKIKARDDSRRWIEILNKMWF
eukprot:gene5383-9190_t